MKVSKLKDSFLYSKAKNKNKEAFIEGYDLYVDQIYRFIFFKTSNKEEAEDLTSAVFLKAWNNIQEKNYLDARTFKTFLYAIARNVVIDHYRKRKNEEGKNKEVSHEEYVTDIVDDKQDLERNLEIKVEFEKVLNRLLQLKDEYREVITLRYVEELSIEEVAKILNKSKGNIRIITFRALKALKELLEQ